MSDYINATGNITVTLSHPLINAGNPITFGGFKLEGQILTTSQSMPTSRVVPLLNGDTITITNRNMSGTISFRCTHTGNNDMVSVANRLKTIGDNVGGTIKITQSVNGVNETTIFNACTVQNCPPLVVAGTDASEYEVTWSYGSFIPPTDGD